MIDAKNTICCAAIVALLILVVGVAHCEVIADEAPAAEAVVHMDRGTLGIMLAGAGSHIQRDGHDLARYYVFSASPRVLRVVRGGPSDGVLEEGDVILTVDGHDLATAEGSRRFMRPEFGAELDLAIRRNGEDRNVKVTVGRYDRNRSSGYTVNLVQRDEDGDLRAVGRDEITSSHVEVRNRIREAESHARRVEASAGTRSRDRSHFVSRGRVGGVGRTRSWYGVGLETRAMVVKDNDDDYSVIYFEDPPRVYSVDPDGPAGRAGVLRGDVLVRVDEKDLDRDEGAELFSAAAPGDTIRLVVRRGESEHVVVVTPEVYPVRVVRHPRTHEEMVSGVRVGQDHLRYAGTIETVDVEVRGAGEVSVTKTEDEIIIETGSATVRLSKRELAD